MKSEQEFRVRNICKHCFAPLLKKQWQKSGLQIKIYGGPSTRNLYRNR